MKNRVSSCGLSIARRGPVKSKSGVRKGVKGVFAIPFPGGSAQAASESREFPYAALGVDLMRRKIAADDFARDCCYESATPAFWRWAREVGLHPVPGEPHAFQSDEAYETLQDKGIIR